MCHGDRAFFAEGFEGGDHDVVAVDFKVLTQLAAKVGTTKTVCAQHFVGTTFGDERTNLFSVGFHVVGRGHNWADIRVQLCGDKRHFGLVGGVQQVVPLSVLAIACEFVEARAAPHVGRNTPIGCEQVAGSDGFAQNRSRAQQVHARCRFLALALLQQIHAFDDLLFGARLEAWHGVVFIQQGDVVENILLLLHHALQTVVQDDADFVGEGGVIRHAVRDGVGHDVAVTIFVLQTFAVQGGASRGTA